MFLWTMARVESGIYLFKFLLPFNKTSYTQILGWSSQEWETVNKFSKLLQSKVKNTALAEVNPFSYKSLLASHFTKHFLHS